MKCSDVWWTDLIHVKWFDSIVTWSEVVTVKFLRIKVLCTLGWTYTEGTRLFGPISLGVSSIVFVLICTVVVLFCFIMWGCLYVLVLQYIKFVICGHVCVCKFVMWGFFNILYVNYHSSATPTEGFPYFFLSCKSNSWVKLAKTGHGPLFPN